MGGDGGSVGERGLGWHRVIWWKCGLKVGRGGGL